MYAATGEAKHEIGVTYLKRGGRAPPVPPPLVTTLHASSNTVATHALNTRAHTKSASWEWVRLKKISTQEVHCLLK